jgi:hypothetical protein
MRCSPALYAVVLCALSVSSACAQSASSSLTRLPISNNDQHSPLNFTYDAQHDLVSASGVQIKPSAKSNALFAPTPGTINVTIDISAVTHFRRDTSFHCSLTVIGGILDLSNAAVVGGIETANSVANWSGPGAATCTLSIPYSWSLPPDPAAQSGLILAFGVAAVSNHEGNSVVHRSTMQLDGIENLPASGTVSNFVFGATL